MVVMVEIAVAGWRGPGTAPGVEMSCAVVMCLSCPWCLDVCLVPEVMMLVDSWC